jgi:nitrogen fixation NifU-like protein
MSNFSPLIVEHFSSPRNMGTMPTADIEAEDRSPVCGDQLHLFAQVRDSRIAACSFLAYGCAAAIGTASILTEAILGRVVEELASIQAANVIQMVGGLNPSQRHCAQLAQDLLAALVEAYRNHAHVLSVANSTSSREFVR